MPIDLQVVDTPYETPLPLYQVSFLASLYSPLCQCKIAQDQVAYLLITGNLQKLAAPRSMRGGGCYHRFPALAACFVVFGCCYKVSVIATQLF